MGDARIRIGGQLHDLGGGLQVRRLLPHAQRRMVGPFVFFDHMGPALLAAGQGVDVRPHPHIGLATVTYLFAGSLRHRDSLGSVQDIRPGDVNWMTAGRGIVHSERTPPELRAQGHTLHGIQVWVALPQDEAECEPAFAHHAAAQLPTWQAEGVRARLIVGNAYGRSAPVSAQQGLFELDVMLAAGATLTLPREHAERAVYVVDGTAELDGVALSPGQMAIEIGGAPGTLRAHTACQLLLLGGAPYGTPPHLWWNFVAATRARIETAKRDWREGRFGSVPGDDAFIPLPDH